MVVPGMTVGLSAAMPGLAGAILRKAGPYAVMREGVTHDGRNNVRNGDAAGREGFALVKLFNLVQQELGSSLLRQGILIPGTALGDFLHRSADTLGPGIVAAQIDNRPIAPHELCNMSWTDREIRLLVDSRPNEG